VEELVGEPATRLAVCGSIEGGPGFPRSLAPAFDAREGFGAGLVLFHNLRKPGPEDDRLGVNAFTLVRGDRGKPIGGKDIVEERGEFRMGGVDGFGALLLENLKLTASPPPLKFRRK